MAEEFFWLTLVVIFTGLMWVPYILKMILDDGLIAALTSTQGNRQPDAPWAMRLKKAHANAVENLVLFAPLVVMVVVSGLGSDLSVMATMGYFFARVAYAVVFAMGLPYFRTITFAASVAYMAVLALILLGLL